MSAQSASAKRQAIAKTLPLELLDSKLLGEVLLPVNLNASSNSAESLDLAGAAIKRLASFVNNGTPEIQTGALDVIRSTIAGISATVVAKTVAEGMSSVVDRNIATKAQDLLQLLASLCHALTNVQQHRLAQRIATSFLDQVISDGSTTHLGAAGTKPAIMIMWFMQGFAPVEDLPPTLIEDILAGIDVSGESSYRSRLISALIQNQGYIQKLGFPSSEGAIATLLKQWYQPGRLSKFDLSAIAIHLLPLLLEKRADLAKSVLNDLRGRIQQEEDQINDQFPYLSAWTAIARVGVVTAGLKLADLHSSSLDCAINHADDGIRLGAWFILSQCPSPTDQIEDIALGEDGLLSQWFHNNMAVSNLEFRNDFLASFGRFVERLYTSANFAIRQSQKPLAVSKKGDAEAETAFERQRVACTEYAKRTAQFVEYLLGHFIDKSIFLPMSTYHARIITGLSMLTYLEEHLGSRKVPKKAGKNQVTWPSLYTKERVECLIACLGSNFTDVRNQSAALLQHAPYPLPGFEDPSSIETILEAALDRLNGVRNTDAEAGGLLIQVLYHSLQDAVDGSQDKTKEADSKLELFLSIYERLEQRLARILGSATLADEPLHGLLLAMIRILSCWSSPMQHYNYSALTKRIFKSVEQIWDICRPIIATQQGDDNQHEIAGAYDVMEETIDETEQVSAGDINKADNAHLTILSNCWRAIKEAGDLVAVLCAKVPAEALTSDLALSAGNLYMLWLRHIRHRGTFSSMAIAFERFLEISAIPHGRRIEWLKHQLAFIAKGDAATTRRSGALPYAVLALVHGDSSLFDEAFMGLSDIVRGSASDSAKIHAMHSIRVMLLDARHSYLFKRYFEESIVISLNAYRTENWSVRNAALLLSANITNRAIGKSLNDLRYKTSRRPTLHEWVKLYPRTLDHFETILEKARDIDEMDPATFIVLLILRSLDTTSITSPTVVPASLTNKLKPLLAKREIKARQAVAQALANLSSVSEMVIMAEDLCRILDKQECKGLNAVHGRILVLEAFLTYRQLDSEGIKAMTEFKPRFLSGAGLRKWPALITDSLSILVDIIVESSSSIRKGTVANSDLSTANQSSILHLPKNATPSQALETLRLLLADEESPRSQPVGTDLWNRLYHTYTSTLNEPLKHVLLPILGRIVPRFSDSSMAELYTLIEKAGQDCESEDSRHAAVSAFRPLSDQLRLSMPQQLFNIADLLLRDDDTTIRSQAAECIGIAFQAGYPICQERAEKSLWSQAIERFSTSDVFAQQLLAEMMDPQDIEQLRKGLKSGAGDLFAEEPANLYVEPYSRKQQLFLAFRRLDGSARRYALGAYEERMRPCQRLLGAFDMTQETLPPLDKRREGHILLKQISQIVEGIAT